MVLALADFDTVGLDVLLSALITAGNNAQAGGTAIYVSGVGTPGGWGTHGTLDDGSLEYVSGSSISRLLYVTGSSTMRFNDNPDPAHIYDFFDSGDGAGTTCYLQTEADGVTSFDIDDGIYRVDGSNWINLLPGVAFFTMLSGLTAMAMCSSWRLPLLQRQRRRRSLLRQVTRLQRSRSRLPLQRIAMPVSKRQRATRLQRLRQRMLYLAMRVSRRGLAIQRRRSHLKRSSRQMRVSQHGRAIPRRRS